MEGARERGKLWGRWRDEAKEALGYQGLNVHKSEGRVLDTKNWSGVLRCRGELLCCLLAEAGFLKQLQ